MPTRDTKKASHAVDELLELLDLVGTDEMTSRFRDLRGAIENGAPVEPWISAAQMLRDLGTMSADFAFWLIDILSEAAAAARIDNDARLAELSAHMQAIERAEGLGEDEAFLIGTAPPAWEAANRDWEARFDHLRMELLRRCGEVEMARLWTLNRDEYDARSSRGRIESLGELP